MNIYKKYFTIVEDDIVKIERNERDEKRAIKK